MKGRSLSEVADELGISRGSVRNHCNRALELLAPLRPAAIRLTRRLAKQLKVGSRVLSAAEVLSLTGGTDINHVLFVLRLSGQPIDTKDRFLLRESERSRRETISPAEPEWTLQP